MRRSFASFSEFYPFYLSEHATAACRRLHFLGIALVIAILFVAFLTGRWWLIPAALVAGYGPAWVGHAVFERNRPATFTHPFYSFAADWVMFRDILSRRIPF